MPGTNSVGVAEAVTEAVREEVTVAEIVAMGVVVKMLHGKLKIGTTPAQRALS
jgi:hypothetical protein